MSNVAPAELTESMSREFDIVLARYSEVNCQPPDLLVAHTDIKCVVSPTNLSAADETYMPYPVLEHPDSHSRDITIVCNTDAMQDTWEPLFMDIDGLTVEDARRIYLGMAFAWVGLVHNSLDAIEQRRIIQKRITNEETDNPAHKREVREFKKRLKSIAAIQSALKDGDTIQHTIDELEVAGIIEANLYPYEITPEEVQRVNRIRYGLGMAYLINGISEDVREQLSVRFADSYSQYNTRLGLGLLEFGTNFGLDKRMDVGQYRQIGLNRAFHSLYFAGIEPMNLSEMICH